MPPTLGSRFDVLSGSGGAHHGFSIVAPAGSVEDCRSLLAQARGRGLTVGPRGEGGSVGDSPVNSGNVALDCRPMSAVERWDPATGVLQAQAGTTMAELLRTALPDGWVPRSIPGGLAITVGGAISHNVHGKDSGAYGNFGSHVLWLDLMLADGEVRRLSPAAAPEEFRAVVGGMGLCGVILRAALQLVRARSPFVHVETRVTRNLEETAAALGLADSDGYAQAWVDVGARGAKVGRGIVNVARFTGSEKPLDKGDLEDALRKNTRLLGFLPARATWRAVRPVFHPPCMDAVSRCYYWLHALRSLPGMPARDELVARFYFFHNNMPEFYSTFQPPGFIQIQALVPRSAGLEPVARLLEMGQRASTPLVLSGMKTHRADGFDISFEGDGLGVSLDFPLSGADVPLLMADCRRIYEAVASAGGKVNLSKDLWLPPDVFRSVYPRHAAFWAVKRRLDPTGLFMNDMARRLFL